MNATPPREENDAPGPTDHTELAAPRLNRHVLAKLTPPTAPSHVVSRPHLRPTSPDDVRLCVLVAPAGFGKTIAAYEVAQATQSDPYWLSVESTDNDPHRFLSYVSAALHLGDDVLSLIDAAFAESDQGHQAAFDAMRTAFDRLTRPVTLVLDDLDSIDNPVIVEALRSWVLVPPENLTLVCTGRNLSILPVDKLRSQGRVHTIGAAELRFDLEETIEIFRCLGVDPEAGRAGEAFESTEGWPALVSLTARAVAEGRSDATGEIDAFLQSEGLRGLDEAQVQFLEATCVVDHLTQALCNVLTGSPTCAAIVDRLLSTSVLLSVDGVESSVPLRFTGLAGLPMATTSVRSHRLLRASLRRKLAAQDPERFRSQLRSAASYFADNDQLPEAIRCAIVGHDRELGQRILFENGERIMHSDVFPVAREWAAEVGPDGSAEGTICLLLGWGEMRHERYDAMHEWLTRAERYSAGRSAETLVQATRHIILAEWHKREGRMAQMLGHSETAITLASAAIVDQFSAGSTTALMSAARCIHGIAKTLTGDFDEGRDLLMATAAASRQPGVVQTLIFALSYLSIIEAYAGNRRTALVYADEAILLLGRHDTPDTDVTLPHLARSIVKLDEGDEVGARQAIETSITAGRPNYGPVQRGLALVQLARVEHHRGALDAARSSLRQARELCPPDHSLLHVMIRRVENELRFLAHGTNDRLPAGARELTSRELEIVAMLPGPLRRSEIAAELHVSENTVKTHLTSIGRKLESRGRAQIVETARRLGILDASDSAAVDAR